MQTGNDTHCHCEEHRYAMRRGNLLVRFTSLYSRTKCCTRRFPRQGFALPRNDMVIEGQQHSHSY